MGRRVRQLIRTLNAFCPTGKGGGKDNSCSSSGGGMFLSKDRPDVDLPDIGTAAEGRQRRGGFWTAVGYMTGKPERYTVTDPQTIKRWDEEASVSKPLTKAAASSTRPKRKPSVKSSVTILKGRKTPDGATYQVEVSPRQASGEGDDRIEPRPGEHVIKVTKVFPDGKLRFVEGTIHSSRDKALKVAKKKYGTP